MTDKILTEGEIEHLRHLTYLVDTDGEYNQEILATLEKIIRHQMSLQTIRDHVDTYSKMKEIEDAYWSHIEAESYVQDADPKYIVLIRYIPGQKYVASYLIADEIMYIDGKLQVSSGYCAFKDDNSPGEWVYDDLQTFYMSEIQQITIRRRR